MRRSLHKPSWRSPIFLFFFLTVILGCKKDFYEVKNGNAVNNSLLQNLKSEFVKNNYQTLLSHTVNDTIQINWVPNWEHASQKEHGDTLKYIYVPLNGQASSPHVKKAVKLKTVNNERYLIITISKSTTTFKLASYDANGAVIKTGQKSQAINSTGAKKTNYFNHTIPFNSFTGGLVTKDLKTGKQNSYYYLQGENNNAAASIGGAKITTNALKTNRLCLVTVRCQWFNNFPEYCGPESTYTERTSYIYEGDNIYDTDCGVPTDTYYAYNDNWSQNPCVPGWMYDGIEIVSSQCQDDPTPPDTPPGDQGSGGGDGGDGDPNTPPGSNGPKDPCEEKNKLNAIIGNSVISDQNTAILNNTQTTHNEWGVGERLTSLTGNQYKNNTIQTNNSPDYVDITFTWNSTDGYTMGTSHGHPGDSTPSPQDIFAMISDYHNSVDLQNAPESDQTFYKDNVSTTVVTSNYFFDITVKDWAALETLYAQYQANPTQFMDDYQTQVDLTNSSMTGLLKIFGNAVNAYYSDITDGRFIPLKLVNGTVEQIDCTQ